MVKPVQKKLHNELSFFNHLRFLMVAFVVLFHASISYSDLVPWWFTHDIYSPVFNIIILLCDVFMMPVLFFISGYFAIPSLKEKGTVIFIISKIKRLGIPFLIGVIFLVPIMPFIRTLRYSNKPITVINYIEFWTNYLKSAGDVHFGFITSADTFNHYHLWFLMLLLTFFIIYSILRKSWIFISKRFRRSRTANKTHPKPSFKILLIFGVITSLGYFISIQLFPMGYWFNCWNIIIFQPTKLLLYIAYFLFGIYGFSNNWFLGNNHFRFSMIWALLSILFFAGLILTVEGAIKQQSLVISLLFSAARSFLCLAILISSISFASCYWNKTAMTKLNMSANSYNIYIVHLPIVVLFQYLFTNLELFCKGAVWIKFGFVFLTFTGT